MNIHVIKCQTPYFQDVLDRRKTFEVRLNDRDYQVDDELHMIEVECDSLTQTGRRLSATISYMLSDASWGLRDNYVVLALEDVKETHA